MYGGADLFTQIGAEKLEPLRAEFVERQVFLVSFQNAYLWGASGIVTSDCVIYPCSIGFNAETHNFPAETQCVPLRLPNGLDGERVARATACVAGAG